MNFFGDPEGFGRVRKGLEIILFLESTNHPDYDKRCPDFYVSEKELVNWLPKMKKLFSFWNQQMNLFREPKESERT